MLSFTAAKFWQKFRVNNQPNPRAEQNAYLQGVEYVLRRVQAPHVNGAGPTAVVRKRQDEIADRVLKLGDALHDGANLRLWWVRGFWAGWAEFIQRGRPTG